MLVFDLLKAGRSAEPTEAPHYVITTDFETLRRLREAATFMAINAKTYPEISDGVMLANAIEKAIAEGKSQL